MPDPGYALLDTGDGSRLERCGGVPLMRPAPAALWPRRLSGHDWQSASLAFTKEQGWTGQAPADWRAGVGGVVFRLRPAAGGQIGVFPEHAIVMDILSAVLTSKRPSADGWRALSLFGHTGMAALRLAGDERFTEIVQVDAQPSAIAQGKENAVLSGVGDRCIRWLADDAMAFLRREGRRERRYDCIVADPPAYGRNRKAGGEWKLERDLPDLIHAAAGLLHPDGVLCLTCHPTGWTNADVQACITKNASALQVERAEPLSLSPESGNRALPAGELVIAARRR